MTLKEIKTEKKREALSDKQLLAETFPMVGNVKDKQVAAFLGIARSSVWRLSKEGKLPRPRKLFSRVTCWKAEEIREFMEGTAS